MKGGFQQLPGGQNRNDHQAKIHSLLQIFVIVVLVTAFLTLIWCMVLSQKVSVLENTVEELRSCLEMMSKKRNISENGEMKSENKNQMENEVGNGTNHIRSRWIREATPKKSKKSGRHQKKKKVMCKHPSAHMVAPTDLTIDSQPNERDTRFVWTFGERGHSDFEMNGLRSAFRITDAGYYYVYFQIAYNGRSNRDCSITNPSCGAYLCQTNSSRYQEGDNHHDYTIIAYSVTTQQRMGCRLGISITGEKMGEDIYAYDTTYAGGIFFLDTNDYIYVKPYDLSCQIVYHGDRTYFGLYRIQ